MAHLPQARRDYARLLLDVVDFASPLAPQAIPQATAMSVADDLERRMRGILDAAPEKRRAWPTGALTLGLACAVIPCQLHYDFVGPGVATPESSAPGAKAGCEPMPKNTANNLPLDDRCAPYTSSFVCPS